MAFVSFNRSSKGDKKRRATQSMAVQAWAAQYLQDADARRFGDDPTLAVSEVKCLEVGCPPMETVVMLLDETNPLTNKVKIQMGLMDVDKGDVAVAVARFMRGEQEERHGGGSCLPGCECHPAGLAPSLFEMAARRKVYQAAQREKRKREEEEEAAAAAAAARARVKGEG